MDTASTSESVTLMLPNADLSFLRTLSKKMGWTFRRHRKTGIEKGLDDIKKGNIWLICVVSKITPIFVAD